MKKAFSLIELSIVILIIGILVAGVTQSSRLVSQMKLSSARAQTQSSPVNSIRDVMIWVESTSEKSFVNQSDSTDIEDGNTVKTWKDISTNLTTRSLSQATTNNQPQYVATAINGLPGVRFDVAKTSGSLNSSAYGDGYRTDLTVFVVLKYTAYYTAFNSYVYVITDNTSEHNAGIGSTGFMFANWQNGTGTINAHTTITLPTATPMILERVYNRTSNVSTFYKNSVQQSTTTASLTASYFASPLLFFLGNHPTAPRPFGGDIGEVIIFDRALKAEERQSIEQYLSRKWGINLS